MTGLSLQHRDRYSIENDWEYLVNNKQDTYLAEHTTTNEKTCLLTRHQKALQSTVWTRQQPRTAHDYTLSSSTLTSSRNKKENSENNFRKKNSPSINIQQLNPFMIATNIHGCHRHTFSKFPDFSLIKTKFPWTNKFKKSGAIAAYSLILQPSFPLFQQLFPLHYVKISLSISMILWPCDDSTNVFRKSIIEKLENGTQELQIASCNLPTQIRFPIGEEHVTCPGPKFTNSLGKQKLELSTRTWSSRAPWKR